MKVLALVLGLLALSQAERVSYHGHKVLRVEVPDREKAALIDEFDSKHGYDLWGSIRIGGTADIRVPAGDSFIEQNLSKNGFTFYTMIEDLEVLVQEERERIEAKRAARQGQFDLNEYHTHDEINQYLRDLEAANSGVSTEVIGQTYEGNDLVVLKICNDECNSGKPIMWIDASIHAREWIGPAVALYMIDKLISRDLPNGIDNSIVDDMDWYFLPVFNADGYRYSWETDRFWRKTRHDIPGNACIGVDANRNFGFHWDEGGASDGGCSDSYHGPEPMSEVEVVAVTDYVTSLTNVVYYQNLHSYSQLIMYPYGYTFLLPEDAEDMQTLGDNGNAALFADSGELYEVGPIYTTIYQASGGAVDWFYGVAGIKYSYTIELRDHGRYGFTLPEEQIAPCGSEIFAFHTTIAMDILAE